MDHKSDGPTVLEPDAKGSTWPKSWRTACKSAAERITTGEIGARAGVKTDGSCRFEGGGPPEHGASNIGATAIIGFHHDSSEVGKSSTEVLCYGTAVVISKEESPR